MLIELEMNVEYFNSSIPILNRGLTFVSIYNKLTMLELILF